MAAPHAPQLLQPEMQTPPNMGQPRQGPPMKGHQGAQYLYDPQLALFILYKGKLPSWRDVEPERQPVSLEGLRRELERLQSKSDSVQHTLSEIISSNARNTVSGLVEEANHELWTYNPNLQWTIAGIDLAWRRYDRKGTQKQLRRIDVVLQTEARPIMKAGKAMLNPAGTGFDFADSLRAGKTNGGAPSEQPPRPHIPNQSHNQSHDQGHKMRADTNANPGPNAAPNPQSNQPHGRPEAGQGMSGPPPPPPPPPPNPVMMQHVSGPPQPHATRNGNSRQQPMTEQHHHHQRQPNPQHQKVASPFPEGGGGPHPGMRNSGGRSPYVEPLKPSVQQQQKAKKSVPGEFPMESDSDFDSDAESLSTQSFSAEDTDDGRYSIVRGRSRSVNRNKSRSGAQSGQKSRSHSRVEKRYKDKISHAGTRPGFHPPPLGEYSQRPSKDNSPKSSSGNLPPNINISVNTTATPTNGGEHDREQTRRDGRRSRDDTKAREDPRGRSHDRRWDTNASRSPRQSYTKFEKPGSLPMSRASSNDYSETLFSQDTSSSRSPAEDSIFDEPVHSHRRGRHHTSVDERPNSPASVWRRPNEDAYRHSDRYEKDHDTVNDYPDIHHRSSRSHRKRPVVHQRDAFHDGEHWHSDQDSSIDSWPQGDHTTGHRNSMGIPNPFNTAQFPPNYPYYTAQKALPDPQMQQDSFDMQEILQAGIEALNQKKVNAFDHIRQSHRPLGRSSTVSGRGNIPPADMWANRTYPAGPRPGAVAARLPDGRIIYVDV